MTYLMLLATEFPTLVFFISLLFGLIIGSFLNVVVHRLPIMMQKDWTAQANEILALDSAKETSAPAETFNLILPNSHCPQCQSAIQPWENIPLISYFFLRGRCSNCDTPISLRYPLVELATGLITALILMNFGVTPAGLACCVLAWALITLALIDFDHQLLPDDITIPLLWVGLIVNYFGLLTSFADAFWGAIAGYLSLWLVVKSFKLLTGKEGMGHGDFKLLAVLGAWMGWQVLPLIIILSSLAGAIIGGILIFRGRDKSIPMPFGPFLAIAGGLTLVWGNQMTLAYFSFTAQL